MSDGLMSRAAFFIAFFGITLAESLNSATGIDHFLLTSEKGMAFGTNIQMDFILGDSGIYLKLVTTIAVKSDFMISGMNIFLHFLFLFNRTFILTEKHMDSKHLYL